MCRSIKTLRPPYAEDVTAEDTHAAALQYVRKVAGMRAPAPHNREAFDAAVEAVTRATDELLGRLVIRGAASPERLLNIGVLALQGDVREHLAALTQAGAAAVPVRRPAELDDIDGLVLPGGESTTIVRLARTFDLLEALRARIKDGLPVFGSCAGMILLADRIEAGVSGQETFGGIDVTVRRNAFGRQVDSFEEDVDVVGVEGGPVHAVFIRAPWVAEVGPAATPLGTAADGHVVAVRQGNLLATSFHPELTGDGRVHALFAAMVRTYTGGS